MTPYAKFILIFSLLFNGYAATQSNLTGTWQGKLSVSPTEIIAVQFIITKQADASYKVVLNSPGVDFVRNVVANKVEVKDGRLSLEVPSLSGSYSGMIAKGTITGEWHQPGSAIPLTLIPYNPPTAASIKPLIGSWVGKARMDNRIVVVRFETAKNGNVVGSLDMPERKVKDLALTDIALEGGQITFKIPMIGADYAGKLSGLKITGGTKESEINFVRGKYAPPASEVRISVQDRQSLLGRWTGKINDVSIVVRFEKNSAGKLVVLLDSPEQGIKDMPVLSATLTKGKLLLNVAAMGEYSATLSGNKIDGIWTQGGITAPLVLAKDTSRQ